ncbi:HAMP domain-containing protein [Paenibacillus sp. LMG 31457]|uniref:histidine kinase n=2 Tax=Paenibacillus planticolens TaxID=2654976 RepID=A0ABX1ZLS9_9BACL|nr:HAMP domain-containing protein [Paenibacillus planticolens]
MIGKGRDYTMRVSFLRFIRRSFFVKVIFILFLVSAIPLSIFAYVTVHVSNQTVMAKVNALNFQVVNQLNEQIDNTMVRIQQLSNQYGLSPVITNALNAKDSYFDYVIQMQELLRTLDTGKTTIGDIADISIYSVDSGEVISTTDSIAPLAQSRYEELIHSMEASNKAFQLIDTPSTENSFLADNSFFMRKLTYSNGTGYRGMLIITLPKQALQKAIHNINLGPDGAVYIVTSENKVIATTSTASSTEISKRIEQAIEGWNESKHSEQFVVDHSLFSIKQSGNFHKWSVISEIPVDQLSESARFITRTALILLMMLMLFGLIGALVIGYNLYRPLQRLKRHMRSIQQGNFSNSYSDYPKNEIGELGMMLNNMAFRLNTLMENLQQSEELKRRSEITALQAQINPHFLYNTLNTISMFAMLKDYNKIRSMLHRLISMLRYSMENYAQLVPLSGELHYITDYIAMLQLRYDCQIIVRTEIDEQLKGMLIPKLLLQPLIENSLFHGIFGKETDQGTIVVRAVPFTEETVMLQIEDDGLGLEPDRLEQLRRYIQHEDRGESIGIKNVSERVRLLFGEQSQFRIESNAQGEGTIVSILIPRHRLEFAKEEHSHDGSI